MRLVVTRKCSTKTFSNKFHKINNFILLHSISDTVKGLLDIRLATLLKREPHTGVSEPAFCRSSTKQLFLNNLQNSQENACAGVSFQIKFRSRRSQVFFKKFVLKQFANFIGKHLCQSLGIFFNKVTGLQNCNFTKKSLQHRFFPVTFAKSLRATCFTDYLQWYF